MLNFQDGFKCDGKTGRTAFIHSIPDTAFGFPLGPFVSTHTRSSASWACTKGRPTIAGIQSQHHRVVCVLLCNPAFGGRAVPCDQNTDTLRVEMCRINIRSLGESTQQRSPLYGNTLQPYLVVEEEANNHEDKSPPSLCLRKTTCCSAFCVIPVQIMTLLSSNSPRPQLHQTLMLP